MREATVDDLPFLERIEWECFSGERFDRVTLLSMLAEPDITVVVDVRKSAALEVKEEARLVSIAVLPEHRGEGEGDELMLWAIALSRERGAKRLVLEVEVTNVPAINLYLKHGLRIAGVIPGYYGEGRDAFYMFLDLAGESD